MVYVGGGILWYTLVYFFRKSHRFCLHGKNFWKSRPK